MTGYINNSIEKMEEVCLKEKSVINRYSREWIYTQEDDGRIQNTGILYSSLSSENEDEVDFVRFKAFVRACVKYENGNYLVGTYQIPKGVYDGIKYFFSEYLVRLKLLSVK